MEFKEKQSIYIQIADYISEQILLGFWPPGERIPSVRDLAASLEVNPNTVVRTYEFLQAKNIISSQRGIGYSAAENAIDLIQADRRERFLETELPEFFKTMYLLNISLEDLRTRYAKFVAVEYPSTT
ncbi:GntR family transcriptional regulator [Persicitalea jodogahamensis]|uniref:GntR family transcriptional regulator n=1 Tax=Persicitalea jodogahamensis TaxID=402147 RepID=A0A8J3D3A0_9BACT|nr:GntR family transcriptional regulator [Persicitalea jodogahamensis]GHB65782.1 GntR family transcriptional regulator [Persicitalea jodogahamensis]